MFELAQFSLIFSGNTVYSISFRASLKICNAWGSGKVGASAHLIGFGGASSFLRAYYFFYFFFFHLGSSSSGFGISLPNLILGKL
jgi:hypothetical protein